MGISDLVRYEPTAEDGERQKRVAGVYRLRNMADRFAADAEQQRQNLMGQVEQRVTKMADYAGTYATQAQQHASALNEEAVRRSVGAADDFLANQPQEPAQSVSSLTDQDDPASAQYQSNLSNYGNRTAGEIAQGAEPPEPARGFNLPEPPPDTASKPLPGPQSMPGRIENMGMGAIREVAAPFERLPGEIAGVGDAIQDIRRKGRETGARRLSDLPTDQQYEALDRFAGAAAPALGDAAQAYPPWALANAEFNAVRGAYEESGAPQTVTINGVDVPLADAAAFVAQLGGPGAIKAAGRATGINTLARGAAETAEDVGRAGVQSMQNQAERAGGWRALMEQGEARLPGAAEDARSFRIPDAPGSFEANNVAKGLLPNGETIDEAVVSTRHSWADLSDNVLEGAIARAHAEGNPYAPVYERLLAERKPTPEIPASRLPGAAEEVRLPPLDLDAPASQPPRPSVPDPDIAPPARGWLGDADLNAPPSALPPSTPPQPPPLGVAAQTGSLPTSTRGLGKAVDRLASTDLPAGATPISNTGAQEIARLRLDKFPEDVRPLIQDAAERMGFGQGQRRGVISDQAAETMADELGRTTEQWIRQGKAGRAYATEEVRALANAITTQAAKVRELGEATRTAGGDSTTAIAQLIIEGDKLAALTALREGAKAEAGRALRAFAQEARLGTNPDDAIARIFAKVGGADNAREMASQYATMVEQGADPIQMAQFWSQVENPKVTWGDWLRALRYNSMLSGPRSMEVDIVGTGAEIPWKLARDTFASIGRSAGSRSAEPIRELLPEIAGIWSGAAKGGQAALETIAHGITTEGALRGELPRDMISRLDNPVAKGAAMSLEWVTRLKGGINELQRQTAYGMAYGRLAGREATREGLRGQAWSDRVAELTANPSEMPGLARIALGEADRLTYANPLGKVGRGIAKLRKDAGLAGHVVLPFYPTVANITARGIDRSPLGLVGTFIDVAAGKYGRDIRQLGKALGGEMLAGADAGLQPLGERLGDNLMGTALSAWFTTKAFDGTITGAGPQNAQEKDVLRAQGWQPYSIRIGDKYVSYANWGPAAITLAGAAAIAEAAQYKAPKDSALQVAADAIRRTAEVYTEQSYLQSVGAIYKALREPERYGSQWINSFMTSLVPEGSLLNTVGQMGDPVNRQTAPGISLQSTKDAFQSRLPGARQGLPEKRTVFGDVEPNPYAGPMGLAPMRVSTEPNPKTANIRRYNGSKSAAEDYQIAQAIGRVTNWQNKPREYEKPTDEEFTLARRFRNRENPQFKQLIQRATSQKRQTDLARKAG